ncbi:hypothetical protein JMK10_17730 [Rhodovulum sulfidophilum]|uniref:hypothetical protein n=1 Tax=Rhodovulum sulfidophilum TaxID=35806 RepID=UPI0019214A3D|nr:hypothetical protein [Rhodovulum sulfidophilum]MBL3575656.1 hypothetical protein [Rhodovulum sulfidophilum]MCE8431412.1 hypothetical protein [Rhodovulum sulfidophilum]MCF4118593.1 hypothetical protein [Rhodovulum sulfidophilum]
MPEKTPKNPFNLEAGSSLPPRENTALRDKDNGSHDMPPPSWVRKPAPNLAPTGMAGIRRNLPSKSQTTPEKPRFTLGEGGKLKGLFKPIAAKAPDKGHGHDI